MMDYGSQFGYDMIGSGFGFGLGIWVIIVLLWSLYWKARSLWRAARLGHVEWFIALLILNTAGILDIMYLYYFTTPEEDKKDSDK